jgi:NAD(P)-dependent dehydrogenase (short-subunit alcohol dehydrogenase family)
MGKLDGKVVILTGASSGMGKATAKILAAEGASVVVTARRVDKIQQTVDEINADGGKAIAVPSDVSVEADWGKVVNAALEKYGRIDVLVNNAGSGGDGYTSHIGDGFSRESWDNVININLFGTVYGVRAVLPELKKNGGGSIINIDSISAISAMGGPSAYTASKGAVLSLTRGLARAIAPDNIRANCILPGIINTEMTAFINDEDSPAYKSIVPHWKEKIKLPRFGTGEDIGGAVLFLASDDSSYITGTEIVVDGGYTIE